MKSSSVSTKQSQMTNDNTPLLYTRFWSLAAIIDFRQMIFCGRASWTLNPRYIAMFSFKKRLKIENLSVFYSL